MHRHDVVTFLDDSFRVNDLEADPAFSRFVPMVYDPIDFDWQGVFESEFSLRFNGLMLRGDSEVGKIWCISFPSAETLDEIMGQARPGDLIFSHHPIDMRCGDPRGEKGEAFIPIAPERIQRLCEDGLSFYSCHVPLDIHPEMSTSDALARAIGGKVIKPFFPIGAGCAGRLCEVAPIVLDQLAERCCGVVGIPYADIQGDRNAGRVRRVAVIAGGGGDVTFYQAADHLAADRLIAGEVTSKIDNDIGRRKQAEIERYQLTAKLAAIGVSHAGSEFLVMKELAPLLRRELDISAEAVAETNWWR